jgi:hypothetical protein
MIEHLSRADLLQYVDGELPKSVMRAVSDHLQSCWACRTELGRLQEDIATIHEAETQVLLPGLPPPPLPWERLDRKIASSLAAAKPTAGGTRWSGGRSRFLRPAVAAATVLAVMGVIAELLWVTPVLSATEILRRVSEAEAHRLAAPASEPFIDQTLRVTEKRPLAGGESGRVEYWRSPKSAFWQFARSDSVAADLKERYHREHIAGLPLSSVSYRAWSAKTNVDGRVSREDGWIDVTFTAVGRVRSGSPREVSLRVRPQDWHITRMYLRFSDVQFEVSELDLLALSEAEVPPDVLSHLEPVARAEEPKVPVYRTPRPARHIAPAEDLAHAPSPDDTEMNVRFVLHQIGADLGEPVQVLTTPGGQVVVQAWGTSAGRRRLIRQLLQDDPHVSVELDPPPDADSLEGVVPLPAASPPAVSTGSAARRDDVRLSKWFGSSAAEADFAHSVLAASTDLLARLYAMKQLADRWPPEPEARLSGRARQELGAMIADDAGSASQRCTELRLMIDALARDLGPAGETPPEEQQGPWQNAAVDGLDAAKQADLALRSILTTSNEPMPLDQALPYIRRRLSTAAADIRFIAVSRQ